MPRHQVGDPRIGYRAGSFLPLWGFPLRGLPTTDDSICEDHIRFRTCSLFSFLFLLRVSSETLMLRMAAADDPITDFTPQKAKILAGVRIIGGCEVLLAKFSRRKNMNRGRILRRSCLCGEPEPMARVLFPPHRIWPQLADRFRTGGLLFPTPKYSSNRHLRANLAMAGISQAGKFPSPCFRRGAAQEMQISGNPDSTLKRAGRRRCMGFRGYIEAQLTDALEISRLISTPTDSDSDGGPDAPTNFACEDSLRKKIRPFPGRECTK